jgi:ribonucleotide monophosphatase NagD (HAD superfamily)
VSLESAAAAPERSTLQRRVAGTRGLLAELDGVLVLRNEPLPGAAEALTRLDAAGVPYVVATNTSHWRDRPASSRSELWVRPFTNSRKGRF